MLEVEMAPGHPWVKNLKADIFPFSTLRYTLIKSPQVGSPTVAMASGFSISPTFLGCIK
jgi:hypothetical protein